MPLWAVLVIAVVAIFILVSVLRRNRHRPKSSSAPIRHIPARPRATADEPAASETDAPAGHAPAAADEDLVLIEYTDLSLLDGTSPTAQKDVDQAITRAVQVKIGRLPKLPTDSLKLNELLRNPNTSASDVASFVSTNPVLTARILQAVNSAYYNLQEKVTSVGRAIVLMGYNNVRAIIMHDSFQKALPRRPSGGDLEYDQLWLHSTTVSACAHHLSHNTVSCPGHDLATMGLLHDIGKYFIHTLDVQDDHTANVPELIQEEMRYGVNHALLGSMISKHWKLSDAIATAIEYHHYPVYYPPKEIPEEIRTPSFIIALADLICRALGYLPENGQLLPIRNDYYSIYKIPSDLRVLITPSLQREIEKARSTVESYMGKP